MSYIVQQQQDDTDTWMDLEYGLEYQDAKKLLIESRNDSPNFNFRIVMEMDD